jgi:hypothetical protein
MLTPSKSTSVFRKLLHRKEKPLESQPSSTSSTESTAHDQQASNQDDKRTSSRDQAQSQGDVPINGLERMMQRRAQERARQDYERLLAKLEEAHRQREIAAGRRSRYDGAS